MMASLYTPEEREAIRKGSEARRAANKRERKARPKVARAAGQRQPRKREPAYLQWVRRLPCVACAAEGKIIPGCHAAHIRYADAAAGWTSPGLQSKPDDRRSLPLCPDHHTDGPDAQHRANERVWWSARGINPPALCSALSAAFDGGSDGALIVQAFARRGSL
jgi:hypothetical protein